MAKKPKDFLVKRNRNFKQLSIYANDNFFNPWHNVNAGGNLPDILNGIIEIPKGTRAKYELDKESGLLRSAASILKNTTESMLRRPSLP